MVRKLRVRDKAILLRFCLDGYAEGESQGLPQNHRVDSGTKNPPELETSRVSAKTILHSSVLGNPFASYSRGFTAMTGEFGRGCRLRRPSAITGRQEDLSNAKPDKVSGALGPSARVSLPLQWRGCACGGDRWNPL